ncbi:MAG: molybdopterin molybdenumtransferase MoeA [Candidatus Marinimicrobia bacterium]|nr:molybdopterin molybdenumtransferase MoeA [Candidatus Neomarinimicrobiota bacterium]
MISFQKAKSIINEHMFELSKETVPLDESIGRVLADNLVAPFSSPRFDNSAMDGFAVCSSDTLRASKKIPIELKMVGISSAGSPYHSKIKSRECVQCMTGAIIPEGADSVVMVEDTSGFSDSKIVKVMIETYPGKHIRMKGEEVNKGDILINRGTTITTNELGVFATFGYGKLNVSKRPKISIFGTGDELVDPGQKLKEGQIYNSNLYVFSDLTEKAGAEVINRDVIKDDETSLKLFLKEALLHSDVIISSGGVSMGRYDYVRKVFIELGVKEHFWKVAQKPGKPLFFGTKDNKLIFGLPGNPVSSFIGYMEWVWPVLKHMLGEQQKNNLIGVLDQPFPLEKAKHRFLFGKVKNKNGKLICSPTNLVGSHMLSSALDANCILNSSPGTGSLDVGKTINFNLLPWKTIE